MPAEGLVLAPVVGEGKGGGQGRGEERRPSQSSGEGSVSRRSARWEHCQGSAWVADVGLTEGQLNTLAK